MKGYVINIQHKLMYDEHERLSNCWGYSGDYGNVLAAMVVDGERTVVLKNYT